MEKRLANEIAHGKYLAERGPGEIWSWESPAGKKRWERRVRMLMAEIAAGAEVLELGCGTGYFTKELAKIGACVTAIDISEELLNIARKTISAPNVRFKLENAVATSFSATTFDRVVGSSVLHHLELDKALAECHRVLKPGGWICFTEPNMLNPQIALQKNIPYLKRKLGDSPDETAFFRWRLRNSLARQGFKNIQITPFDWLHPSTPVPLIPLVQRLGGIMEKLPVMKEFAGSLYIRARKM